MVTAQAPTSYEGRREVECIIKFKCKEMVELNWNVVFYNMQKLTRMLRNEELFYLVNAECNCDSIHNILE